MGFNFPARGDMRARYPVTFGPVPFAPLLFGLSAVVALVVASSIGLAATGTDDPAKAAGNSQSLLGSYLAGRVARGQHDTGAAATYYR